MKLVSKPIVALLLAIVVGILFGGLPLSSPFTEGFAFS